MVIRKATFLNAGDNNEAKTIQTSSKAELWGYVTCLCIYHNLDSEAVSAEKQSTFKGRICYKALSSMGQYIEFLESRLISMNSYIWKAH